MRERFYPIVDSISGLERLLDKGYTFIQLRVKELKDESVVRDAVEMSRGRSTLIINDYVELAKKYDADGVHLGKSDMSIDEARKLLGKKILGATTNSLEDIVSASKVADYVGLGPYRFTTTKQNLAPILGERAFDIKQNCDNLGIKIPIFLIGGIEKGDVDEILAKGFGISGKKLFEEVL